MLQNMRIKSKLSLFSTVVVISTLLIAAIGLVGVLRIDRQYRRILQVSVNNTHIRQMVEELLEIRVNVRSSALYIDDDAYVEQCLSSIAESRGELNRLMELLEGELVTDRARELFAPMVTLHGELSLGRQRAVELITARDRDALLEWVELSAEDVFAFQDGAMLLGELCDQLVQETRASARRQVSTIAMLSAAVAILAVGVTVLLSRKINRHIAVPVMDMVRVAEKISTGDMDVAFSGRSGDEIGQLESSFERMVYSMKEQTAALEAVSNGDLTVAVAPRSERDSLNQALRNMLERNQKMVVRIQEVSQQVMYGAGQISKAAQVLASGSIQQASSIEEFSSVLSTLSERAEDNARHADESLKVSGQTHELAKRSLANVRQSQEAMRHIETSAENIAAIIGVIEDIAFQTNILSLNAAVEAARAGEAGRGFAVVAEEVRRLSYKSSQAAQETTALITASINSIKQGAACVEQTSAELADMQGQSEKSVGLVRSISDASEDQRRMIQESSLSIRQISAVVQSISTNAEQTAAAAQELAVQSDTLGELVSTYKVSRDFTEDTRQSKPAHSIGL